MVNSQAFEHIESYVGFGDLKENNAVAIADFDNDGDLDIFVVAKAQDQADAGWSHSRLFSNNNDGTFSDVTEGSGLVNLFPPAENIDITHPLSGYKYGAFWGDYDNDGFPDLFMTGIYRIQLFHNEGNGKFKEVTTEAGFSKINICSNTDASWFDYNKDGFLDIYVLDWGSECEGNRLYKNNGDGTFSNVNSLFGEVASKRSYQSVPFDFNGDGWLDIYVANDHIPGKNDLFINNNGEGFTDAAAAYGMDDEKSDMGVAIGDYNNDGSFDILVTTIGENVLYTNTGNSTYQNLGKELGVLNAGWAWDASFSDFDLDRDEDLFIANGFAHYVPGYENNFYFENQHANGGSGFTDSSKKAGLAEETMSVGAGVFDFDNDGDLDLFVSNSDRASYFYENKITDFTHPATDLHWFKIKLVGTVSNRDAIGTKLSIKTASGTLHRYFSGKGFVSQNLVPVHFGLGADTQILELIISWPSGLVEKYNGISANHTIQATEGSGYKILEEAPSVKTYGCTDVTSCSYNPFAVVSTGSCTYLKSGTIAGQVNAIKESVETYSYTSQSGSTLVWTAEGGTVVSGQNSSKVTISWGTQSGGILTVIESNSICSTQPVKLSVNLRNKNEPIVQKYSSIARLWNEALLDLIRKDYARPTVHARNLFHTSMAIYDAWAIYDETASPYLIGNTLHGYKSEFTGFSTSESILEARKKTISYAAYRLLSERFQHSPNPEFSQSLLDEEMAKLGYDILITDQDYTSGSAIALGNYIANQVIAYGLQDGSNEENQYANVFYVPENEPLDLNEPGDISGINPNRWQPLTFTSFIDQSGNVISGTTPDFLGPEWGNVKGFSLSETDKVTYSRDGHDYNVYFDPGTPPSISSEDYKWTFSLVSKWGSHLDPYDGVLWDISPKSKGNVSISAMPQDFADFKNFYKEDEGGDIGIGRPLNPVTKMPYEAQIVPRGDYTRVLAEFWADGPDSETPPGHWFTILNYVSDHPLLKKRFKGQGNTITDLEWDVKSYFILGGAMHDAAITAWGIKGWYDYIRPISAIRYMCAKGQCSDPSKAHYDTSGIPLKPGYIELVTESDPLAGANNENVGKIKLFSWKGHEFINDPTIDEAGVGWILAENWWPYQRPTFVTPPFAGYVSGHSTYSRAAAEVLTLLTGTEYFPGGMGEFLAKKNEFLVFEQGPSMDVKLQWATYRDASDQCSLSRIWGGIHPPADDIPGRKIGEKVGKQAFEFASKYFSGLKPQEEPANAELTIYPNPLTVTSSELFVTNTKETSSFALYDINGRLLQKPLQAFDEETKVTKLTLPKTLSPGIYILKIDSDFRKIVVVN